MEHKVRSTGLNIKALESTNPKFGLFAIVNTFRMFIVVVTPVQFCVSTFVLWYLLKMTETGMQTKGRVKGNVLIFSFYFIFSFPKLCLKVERCFPLQKAI